jgi:hypothetical protein
MQTHSWPRVDTDDNTTLAFQGLAHLLGHDVHTSHVQAKSARGIQGKSDNLLMHLVRHIDATCVATPARIATGRRDNLFTHDQQAEVLSLRKALNKDGRSLLASSRIGGKHLLAGGQASADTA